jgi:hypothetical protein
MTNLGQHIQHLRRDLHQISETHVRTVPLGLTCKIKRMKERYGTREIR